MIDPEFEAILAVLEPSDISDPAAQRQRVALACAPLAALADHRVTVRDEVVPGAVPVRVYTPTAAKGTVLFFHGGGFVMGTLDLEQRRCLHWAAHAGVVVVSVDYRLAPEYRYPASVEDGETVLAWLRDGSGGLPVVSPAAGPLVVAGSSAGGCVAATLAARHRRDRPSFALQLLICPVLDDRTNSGSMTEFESTPGWNGRASAQMWKYYLGPQSDAPPRDAVPARAADLAGQPPAFIVVAQLDPLRDEGLEHARRLAAADVPVELHHVAGVPHGFDIINPDAQATGDLLAREVAALHRAVQDA